MVQIDTSAHLVYAGEAILHALDCSVLPLGVLHSEDLAECARALLCDQSVFVHH